MPYFYHVDRVGGRLKAGQIIDLIHDKSSLSHSSNRSTVFASMFPNGVSYHGWNFLLNPDRTLPKDDLSGQIELLAEFFRRTYFRERPSRFQSFFAFKTIQDAKRFISHYPIETQEEGIHHYDIWSVKCESVEFQGDMNFLKLGNCWLDAIINMQFYWSGEMEESPLVEVLLKPPINHNGEGRNLSKLKIFTKPLSKKKGLMFPH